MKIIPNHWMDIRHLDSEIKLINNIETMIGTRVVMTVREVILSLPAKIENPIVTSYQTLTTNSSGTRFSVNYLFLSTCKESLGNVPNKRSLIMRSITFFNCD